MIYRYLISLLLFVAVPAYATTHNITCSGDITSALNALSLADGDKIALSSGSCTISGLVTIGKGVEFYGAGAGSTIINNNYTTNWQPALLFNGTMSQPPDIHDFTMQVTSGNSYAVHIKILTVADDWHIHDVTFTNGHGRSGYGSLAVAISCPTAQRGRIGDNTFLNAGADNGELIQPAYSSYSASWAAASTIGTLDNIFIEYNSFSRTHSGSNGHCVMAYAGARVVFRYNHVEDMDFDAHGHCSNYSARHYEVYGNTWEYTADWSHGQWMFLRGGTGIITGNTMTNTAETSDGIVLTQYKVDDPYSNCFGGCCGTYPGDYPCDYQIGRGQNQGSEPLYVWNNTSDGVTKSPWVRDLGGSNCGSEDTSDWIASSRDYYASAHPTWVAYGTHPLDDGADGISPTVNITSPTSNDSITVYNNSMNLGGTASDNDRISSVSWACPTCSPTSDDASGTTEWTISGGTYAEGANVVTVTASDPTGNTAQDTITVTYSAADTDPPTISNTSPSGALVCTEDPRDVTMSLSTSEYATCKYDTSDVAYASMGNTFSTTGTTSHSQSISVVRGTAKKYYIRCIDGDDNANTSSTIIQFSVASGSAVGANMVYNADSAPITYNADGAPITLQ
jgi:hypothetical protein